MKKALILDNAYYNAPNYLYQSSRMKEEFKKLGVRADVVKNDFFAAFIGEGGELVSGIDGYDFCVYFDKDKYISEMLEAAGMRLFNSHKSIRVCDDKMTTAIALLNSGIPLPKTLAGLLCYRPEAVVSEKVLDRIEKELGYPLIVKTCFGSLGRGVYKIDDRRALRETAEKLKLEPHVFQRFEASSFGRDIRVIVIGGKCVAAMLRTSDGDFRSNLALGGVGKPIDPPEEVEKICVKAAETLGLDFCGVDVLFGENGYLVCEVNSNAFFGGIERATGVNIAKIYAEHVLSVCGK